MSTTLVTGAAGQIGTDLVRALRARAGADAVVATDLAPANGAWGDGPAETLDVTDANALSRLVGEYDVDTVYHLASLLSATGERKPSVAWEVNVNGLRHVLEAARELGLRVFWPSSIASLTLGGIGSFHASGFQSHSRTQPPILEYVRSGAFGSASKYSAGSQRAGSTSLIEYRPARRFSQNVAASGASGRMAPTPTMATERSAEGVTASRLSVVGGQGRLRA